VVSFAGNFRSAGSILTQAVVSVWYHVRWSSHDIGDHHMTSGGHHMTSCCHHMTSCGHHMTSGGHHMTSGGHTCLQAIASMRLMPHALLYSHLTTWILQQFLIVSSGSYLQLVLMNAHIHDIMYWGKTLHYIMQWH